VSAPDPTGDRRVRIYEVGPRDGLQNEPASVATADKARYIALLAAAGLREIEATSFVSPSAIPQLADADELLGSLRHSPGVRYPVLVPNLRGLARAEAAGADALAVFTATTDSFTEHNIGMTVADSLAAFAPVLARAEDLGWWRRGYVSTAFGCPYTGRVEPDTAVDVALRLLDLGVNEVCFGDTIGVGAPSQVLELTDDEREGLSAPDKFRVDVTPYFISLIDPKDPTDPIRRQVIPSAREAQAFTAMMEDSLAEDRHSPVPGLVHRYPDRVLMLVTTQCASYCRYCTRSRIVGDPTQNFNRKEHEAQLEYLRRTPQVRDVLISGGDGLTLAPKLFESILRGLREIPHIEIIRIGSRVPVFLPQRIDDELCEMLEKYHPLWINLHFNHPNEITPEVSRAVDKLSRTGLPIGNQSVLLAGVNDCVHIQRALVHKMVANRIRPYYLYQCDLVEGSGHFRTPVGKGLEIIEGLRGHTSGYAVPTYVIDAPGGGGKIPLLPDYVAGRDGDDLLLVNYEGRSFRYPDPADGVAGGALP